MDFPGVAHVPLLRRRDQIDEVEAGEAAEDGDGGCGAICTRKSEGEWTFPESHMYHSYAGEIRSMRWRREKRRRTAMAVDRRR
ncbi:hypothetical protein U1Q18_008517 [Sarracenia purpurea var. burkii]